MKGNDIYDLGDRNIFAQLQAESDLIHTAPRMSFDERWCAEFWYFVCRNKRNGKISLSAPRLYLAIQLPSRKLLASERIDTFGREMLGFNFDSASCDKSAELKQYLTFCDKLTATAPDKELLQAADELWRKTLPNVLREWFEDNEI